MDELLPGVEQRFCVRHLYNNFRKKHPGKRLKELMWKAANATYPQEWERVMKEIRKISEEAFKYLLKIPPRHWSKSRFTFNSKCDVLVNNMSETFNSVIVGPRQKPIVTMFEDIRGYFMERWATNRTKVQQYNGFVLPKIKTKLQKECELSRNWMCRLAGDNIYGVSNINHTGEVFTINLEKKECSCRKWMLTGIPCCHAITCCNDAKQNPEDLIPAFYRVETYEACYRHIIYPTNGKNVWATTPYLDILPPPLRKLLGRPKRRRNKDGDEKARDSSLVSRKGMPARCSKCKQSGHNKASCKGPSTQANNNQGSQTQTAANSNQTAANPTQTTGIQSQNAPNLSQTATNPTQTAANPTQTAANQKKTRGRPRKLTGIASTQPTANIVAAAATSNNFPATQPTASSRVPTSNNNARPKMKTYRP